MPNIGQYEDVEEYVGGETADVGQYSDVEQVSGNNSVSNVSQFSPSSSAIEDTESALNWAAAALKSANASAVSAVASENSSQASSGFAIRAEEALDGVFYNIDGITAEGTKQVNLIKAEGTTQKTSVTQTGSTQVTTVQTAGTTQSNLVISEGSRQKGIVTSEGNTQKAAVVAEGNKQADIVTGAGSDIIKKATDEGNFQASRLEDKGDEVSLSLDNTVSEYSNNVAALGEEQLTLLQQSSDDHVNEFDILSSTAITTVNSASASAQASSQSALDSASRALNSANSAKDSAAQLTDGVRNRGQFDPSSSTLPSPNPLSYPQVWYSSNVSASGSDNGEWAIGDMLSYVPDSIDPSGTVGSFYRIAGELVEGGEPQPIQILDDIVLRQTNAIRYTKTDGSVTSDVVKLDSLNTLLLGSSGPTENVSNVGLCTVGDPYFIKSMDEEGNSTSVNKLLYGPSVSGNTPATGVDIDSSQVIYGEKIFSGGIIVNDGVIEGLFDNSTSNVADCNEIYDTGSRPTNSVTENVPPEEAGTGRGILVTMVGASWSYRAQTWYKVDAVDDVVYNRVSVSSTLWGGWKKVAHTEDLGDTGGDFVDLTTDQVIAGSKIFTQPDGSSTLQVGNNDRYKGTLLLGGDTENNAFFKHDGRTGFSSLGGMSSTSGENPVLFFGPDTYDCYLQGRANYAVPNRLPISDDELVNKYYIDTKFGDFMDKSTEETVGGLKTFRGGLTVESQDSYHTTTTVGIFSAMGTLYIRPTQGDATTQTVFATDGTVKLNSAVPADDCAVRKDYVDVLIAELRAEIEELRG